LTCVRFGGEDDRMATIGSRIKKRRQVLGMKQHELAAAVGVDRSAVSNWERGRHLPQRYQGKLEEILGISLDEPDMPAIPADIEMAIRRNTTMTPEEKDLYRRILREVLTEMRDGPDVNLHGALVSPQPPSSHQDPCGALT